MTTSPFDRSTDRHPSDGVLLALHDKEREDMFDEAREAELEFGRRHVERCNDCRTRLAGMAAHSTRVREALASIPVPSITADAFRRRLAQASARRTVPRWRRPAWQAAAAVLIVAGVAAAAATGPIRVWLRHRAERPAAEQRSPTQRPAATPQESLDRSGATVSFAAGGPDFTVRFDSLPVAGVLSADSATGADIIARVVSGAGTGGDAMVVLPGELRVRNSTGSRASYAVSVPRVVTRLRVIVAGHAAYDGAPRVVVQLHPPR